MRAPLPCAPGLNRPSSTARVAGRLPDAIVAHEIRKPRMYSVLGIDIENPCADGTRPAAIWLAARGGEGLLYMATIRSSLAIYRLFRSPPDCDHESSILPTSTHLYKPMAPQRGVLARLPPMARWLLPGAGGWARVPRLRSSCKTGRP